MSKCNLNARTTLHLKLLSSICEKIMDFEKLKSLLECPVCFETASQPIYNCPNGHIICRMCAPRLKYCPVCRTMVVQGSRNIVAERLSSECDFPCRYTMHGCNTVSKGCQIASHESTCDFRPIKCVVRLCKEGSIANFLQYYEHLTLSHGIIEASLNQSIWERDIPISNNIFFIKEATKKPAGMVCYGERFLQFLDADEQNIWIWMSLCGPLSNRRSHSFEVTFKIREISENMEISWTGPIHNVRETSRDVYASGLCLVTNKTVLKRFIVDNPVGVGDSHIKLQIILKSIKRIDISTDKKSRKLNFGETERGEGPTVREKLLNLFACGKH